MNYLHRIGPVIPLAFFILIVAPKNIYPVQFIFSEPVVLDSNKDYAPVEQFNAPVYVRECNICSGPAYDLVLFETQITNFWHMTRIDKQGRLVDTMPRLYRCPDILSDNPELYTYINTSWAAPYYYVWERKDDYVYYTRIDENLVIIDPTPVSFIYSDPDITYTFAFDGPDLWVVYGGSSYNASLYQVPSPTPILENVEINAGGSPLYKVRASNGLFLVILHQHQLTYEAAYVSKNGTIELLGEISYEDATLGNRTSNSTLIKYNADTLIQCWFVQPTDTNRIFRYFFITPHSRLTSEPIREIEIPLLHSSNYYRPYGFEVCNGSIINIGKIHLDTDYRATYVRLNPVEQTVVESGYFPDGEIPTDIENYRLFASDTSGYLYHQTYKYARLVTFSLINPFGSAKESSLYYGSRSNTNPTILADENGLLVYNRQLDTAGSTIHGYRLDYSDPPSIVDDFTVLDHTQDPFMPKLYEANDQTCLLWYREIAYRKGEAQVTLFNGDQPTAVDISQSLILDTASGDDYRSSMAVIDSFLYVDIIRSASFLWPWNNSHRSTLRSINIADRTLSPLNIRFSSDGVNGLVVHNDTVIVVESNITCNSVPDYMTGECEEMSGPYAGWGIANDTIAFSNTLHYSLYPAPPMEVYVSHLNNDYILSFTDDYMLRRVNSTHTELEDIVNIGPLIGTGDYFGSSDRKSLVVETNDYYVVFVRHRGWFPECRMLAFDKEWNFLYLESIPWHGIVGDASSPVAVPDENKVYFAYSAYLAEPYFAVRTVVQSLFVEPGVAAEDEKQDYPDDFCIGQNAPNPFNASTKIEFYAPRTSHTNISIFNILGQHVKTLLDEDVQPGKHTIFWDGTNRAGLAVATGIYFYQIEAGTFVATRKMLLLK